MYQLLWGVMAIEYVDHHHRMPRELRRRLKIAAAEKEMSMTDIVNEAISLWLDGAFVQIAEGTIATGPVPTAVATLRKTPRAQRQQVLINIPIARLVDIGKALDLRVDTRFSKTSVIDLINAALPAAA